MTYMGIECWTVKELSIEKGISRSTIRSWIRRTIENKLDMPFFESPVVKGRYYIPKDSFEEWYSYIQN